MAKRTTQNPSRKHLARKLYRQAIKLERKGSAEHVAEAAVLLRQAVRLGSGVSALKLAEICLNKNCSDLYDPEAAMKLLRRLADRGNASACFMLGQHLHKQGENEEAAKYLTTASNKENAPAKALLGKMRLKGDGVEKNTQQGVRLLSEAARAGNIEAQLTLAEAYYDGQYLPENAERSVFWIKQAALQKDTYAQTLLAAHCFTGYGVDRDTREGYFWIHQAAKQGLAYAQACVGECLQEGLGVRRNKSKGAKFYAKAAEQGSHFATARLGLCYILGRGVKQDKKKGIALLRKAMENGNEFAPIYLVMFGKLKYIPVDTTEIEQCEKRLKESGHAISFSAESVPIIERKKNWIQDEYDHIEFLNHLSDDDEDDGSVPGPFDPLLNLGRRLIAPFTGKRAKK